MGSGSQTDQGAEPPERRPNRLVERVALATAMTAVGLNLWTGAPLLAVWVASQVQRGQPGPTTSTVFVVVGVLVVTELVLYRAFRWLDVRFGVVIGRKPGTRQPVPWLKSASAERVPKKRPQEPLTIPERVVVLVVVAAIGAFEVWFFFLAGGSLPNQ